MTDQKTPDSPQERPKGGFPTPRACEGWNGPQADADGLRLRELITGALTHCPDISTWDAMAGAVLDAITPHLATHHPHTVDQAEKRLRLAHQARRAKEHQLDDIRRALCDIGFMEDDDPYSHADLADVIRQNGQATNAAADLKTLGQTALGYQQRAWDAEAELKQVQTALDRVRALHPQEGDYCANCTEDYGRLSAPWPCPTIRALNPPARNAGPTVAECAEADRAYWTDKHAGDQP
ncbi:hypothetical protein KYY02_19245 [Streptomyces pimonensis]|uniref:Uncharacterized protein n=1 Tax=Streptomyces pimonensis TaxID=2860288 RepID=A0ABV4J4J7_9ACTN